MAPGGRGCHACGGGRDGGQDQFDDLLDALEEDLLAPDSAAAPSFAPAGGAAAAFAAASSAAPAAAPAAPAGAWPVLGRGLAGAWPAEIRLGVAGFLPWRELVLAQSRLCRAWQYLEQDVTLWWPHFRVTWPRHSIRQAERVKGPQDWRQLFRTRWLRGDRDGDATHEDWLDLYAAQEVVRSREGGPLGGDVPAGVSDQRDVRKALERCRAEVLRAHGVDVPAEADGRHVCTKHCRFHKLPDCGDTFVCESSGVLHRCGRTEPCHICIVAPDNGSLVCPVSGKSYELLNYINEAVPDEVDVWDPAIGESEQMARWFEQGYNMSEEQALDFFAD